MSGSLEVVNQTDIWNGIIVRNINDAMKALRLNGWTFGNKDLCPECSKKNKEDK